MRRIRTRIKKLKQGRYQAKKGKRKEKSPEDIQAAVEETEREARCANACERAVSA